MIVDACGNPCEFIVTDGTTHDIKVAPELLSRVHLNTIDYVSADKGYDSASFREEIINQGAKAIIPKKRNALTNKYDKLKQHYENNVALACAYIWLKL